MAQEAAGSKHPEGGVIDRFTGREDDEFSPSDEMTLTERIDRFEEAETSLAAAERVVAFGGNKADALGTYEDVSDAIEILSNSARYHASHIDPQELKAAEERGDVPDYVAEAVIERQSELAKENRSATMSEDYYARLDEHQKTEPEADLQQDRDKDIDGGRER